MSHTSTPGAFSARQVRQFTKKFTSGLTGREQRGPDWSDDPQHRTPHRDSYDVDDARAKPWAPIGGGKAGANLAFIEATKQVAREIFHQEWLALPHRRVRELRHERAVLAAELAQLQATTSPAPGRPAAIRQRLGVIDADLERARLRPRRVDLTVLAALLRHLDFRTGALFPAKETIARAAGCHRNSVHNALRRLKAHGLIDWVRRTARKAGAPAGEPQREQTSNAYFFDHRRSLAAAVWHRFQQLLGAKLRRLATGTPVSTDPTPPPQVQDPTLRATLAALGAAVTHAST